MGTNSALRASSLAIKRVMEGRIAHLGHQFGTSCLIPGNQKVREWIVKYLRQIDGLQIRHFVPHPAIKKWQLRGKQLCEGVPAPEQYHVTGTHYWKALNVLFQTTTKPHEANHRKPRYSALKIGQKLCNSAGQNLIRKLIAPPDDFFTPFQQLKRPANGLHPRPQIWQPKGS
ncbi:hypothetical protein GLOIN_2v1480642 [Rhizophagus irregularis DAOM 181602=DAOM 197198]|uniref:Uncharacterized protein n=1 Tax=Rhizophagus irregularis (strain DAOM 181602 / DAOM 197198 / MUCL 43194) TaxID=747089 RepID=A0A2P4PTG9_RHIID|nr:hypothetical protein GLOIN_2v1480642 [Rhizophagus irregularis DAOM 181602=DAOM 197198]POG68682.1 hypothetical protein GLOIN_2v1480642 [Rhizophagus irregularis DAOM 181602=DAOM 197198]|eukprot:XP_025175548.1 hypothetical protein GLOIN_2v1480642 [Rhizophagus irregularis DAOM 181602=DAOM 197198]